MKYWLYLCNSAIYFFKVYLVSIINFGSIYFYHNGTIKIFLNEPCNDIVGKTCCRRCGKCMFCEAVLSSLLLLNFCVIALIYMFLLDGHKKGREKNSGNNYDSI